MHFMLDLETLGSNPRAPIAAIGVACFDPVAGTVGDTLYERIEVSCYDRYRGDFLIDYSTIGWWMKQSDEAIKSTFTGPTVDVTTALGGLTSFMVAHESDENERLVWGNGADFDPPILGHCYESLKLSKPWRFYNNRCFRTMKSVFSTAVAPPVFEGERYNALADAVHQARWLCQIYRSFAKAPA